MDEKFKLDPRANSLNIEKIIEMGTDIVINNQ